MADPRPDLLQLADDLRARGHESLALSVEGAHRLAEDGDPVDIVAASDLWARARGPLAGLERTLGPGEPFLEENALVGAAMGRVVRALDARLEELSSAALDEDPEGQPATS